MKQKTVGLPRMHKEAGERRDFLPRLITFLERVGAAEVVIEAGYGSGMGLTEADYRASSARCRVGTLEECYAQDVVAVLRYPAAEHLALMRPGAILLSMVHFPTRPGRVADLRERGIRAVSLDSLADDRGTRLVEDLASVGWNGVRAAFEALARLHPRFDDPAREPLHATLLGAGAVGSHAMRAATAYGDPTRRGALVARGVKGVQVTVMDFDVASDRRALEDVLPRTDVLIDATRRPDASQYVVPNALLGLLPAWSVVVDLSVDPYDFSSNPRSVKGLEGVPEGNLDQYLFAADDPAFDRLPPQVSTRHRRTSLSCYSWPGVRPRECMENYGIQLEPVLRVLLERPLDSLDVATGPYYDRAVARAEVSHWRPTP